MIAVLAAVLTAAPAAEPPPRPHLVATVALLPMTSFLEGLGATVTVHAIPYVDVEGGLFGPPSGLSWQVRAGPRFTMLDARDDAQRGWTLRVSARFGFKRLTTTLAPDSLGFNFAGCVDLTRFFAPHFGLGLHVAGGGVIETRDDVAGQPRYRRSVPELRAALAFVF